MFDSGTERVVAIEHRCEQSFNGKWDHLWHGVSSDDASDFHHYGTPVVCNNTNFGRAITCSKAKPDTLRNESCSCIV